MNDGMRKLSDQDLFARLERLTQKERKLTLEILLHLSELDRRGAPVARGYRSIDELANLFREYSLEVGFDI